MYLLICGYWLLSGLINVTALFNLQVSPGIDHFITLLANYTDVPIVLYIFYVASDGVRKNVIKITFFVVVAFELCVIMLKGINDDSVTIVLGVSLIVIIVFGIVGITSYFSKIEHTPKENVMVFVYSSFLFFYGTFIIVYAFSYLANRKSDKDTYLLYYLELFIAAATSIYGFYKFAGLKATTQETRRKVEGF
jgi:apolipoprotein N-acyltransferase